MSRPEFNRATCDAAARESGMRPEMFSACESWRDFAIVSTGIRTYAMKRMAEQHSEALAFYSTYPGFIRRFLRRHGWLRKRTEA